MTFLQLFIYSLAAFRLSYLLTTEAGPFHLARKLRSLVSRKTPKKSYLNEGIRCPYCTGLQVAILLTAYLMYGHLLTSMIRQAMDFAIIVLAIGGLGILLHQLLSWLRRE